MADNIFSEMKRYPIIFIGSGISKRFLENYPNWEQLLNKYWLEINQEMDFYSYLLSLKTQFSEVTHSDELAHKINVEAARYIEDKYNTLFNNGDILIEGLTTERVFKENISPFKYAICKDFSNYKIKADVDSEELNAFKLFLKKAKIIITTNYDPFIENLLSDEKVVFRKYVGNKGLFDESESWSELYKIHGDVSDSKSIVINKDDYDLYDQNSILISAKILSNLITNQIIFLGYSLTDRNIRKLLRDFSSQIPQEDERKSAQRIIVVEYEKNKQTLDEIHSSEFGVTFVRIKTDNYSEIFLSVGLINEGLSPSDVLRYKSLIKDLIVQEGMKGNLEAILVSPSDLSQLEKNFQEGKNVIVALGNDKLVYTHLREDSYVVDYFNEESISPRLAIDFIAGTASYQRIPFVKYINQVAKPNIDSTKKRKINARIKKHGSLASILNTVKLDQITTKLQFNSINEIKLKNFDSVKEINIIIKNIKTFDINDIKEYIQTIAIPLFTDTSAEEALKSQIRKLFCAYDIYSYGEPKSIK